MKQNKKEKVYEFIMEYSSDLKHDEYPRFTTNFLSQKLDMQRTNLSSILNQLVKEGKLIKHNGRPVLYQYADENTVQGDCFKDLIGYDQSLKKAIASIKAAILYPKGKSTILLTAERGSGITYFAETAFQFAVKSGVIKKRESMMTFDCKSFKENKEYVIRVLFGSAQEGGLLSKSENGMLLLENIQYLNSYERKQVFSEKNRGILLLSVAADLEEEEYESMKENADFVIEIPSLQKRKIQERFLLLKKFFHEEAKRMKRNLEVDSSILHALLLYDVKGNIRGLKNDVHTGCANCYARSYQSRNRFIEVLLSDFPNYVRKGIIYYRGKKEEVDALITSDCKYAFTEDTVLKNQKNQGNFNIYQSIDAQKRELKEQQISEEEIDTIISTKLREDFQKYYDELSRKIQGREQLKKVVSDKLIQQVEAFLNNVQQELETDFQEKLFCALCLHVNACLVNVSAKQRISNEEIQQIITTYPREHQLAKDFVGKIEQEFQIHMNIDEIIFIMLFLIQSVKKKHNKVVTLIAMHGNSSASSIAEVINVMANERTTYAYDLSLEKNIHTAYEELKEKMMEINQGKGIILIYDMGSIRTMGESIANETGISVKFLEMPITLLGVVGSNKAAEKYSLDEIFEYLQENFKNFQYFRKSGTKDILIILSDKQQEADDAKEYVTGHFNPEKTDIHTIVTDDMNFLYNEINRISEMGNIIGIVGSYDPNLVQYPFAEIKNVYHQNVTALETLFSNQQEQEDGVEEAFDYLKEQFQQMDMDKMRKYLLEFIERLEYTMNIFLDEDKKIGLIVHIVCVIDKIQNHQMPSVNFIASDIIKKHGELVNEVKKLLEPLEQEFQIYINEIEIATIVSIIQK